MEEEVDNEMQFCLYQEGRNVLDIKNKRLTDRESGAICM
ncbi:MAG: hypothetical protein K0S41_4370, partial [Anaerocolumna sp.]|nr:hypothetical protein [Anaerocolumna sp.]